MDLKIVLMIVQVVLLFIIAIASLILLFLRKNQNSKGDQHLEQFKITFKCFDSILSNYQKNVLKPKIDVLIKDHDLDPKSQTNSRKLFLQKKETLIKEATNEVFAKYITRDVIDQLDVYYTRDGLLLFIITFFRG